MAELLDHVSQEMTKLYPLIVDLHTASLGNILTLLQVISDLMRHPVPPQVARRILRPQDDRFNLPGLHTITTAELVSAIESFMMACDTAQMYADVILRHTTRLRTADTIEGNMLDLILDFHIFVEGDLTKIALLLADLAPLPHTGDVLPKEMTRSLLQCYSGTVCSFPNILRCLKRFIYEHDSEERPTSVIAGHLLPSQSRPQLPGPTDPPPRHQLDTSFPGPTCSPWRETLREWLIDCEVFEAVPQIEFPCEDPDSSNPGKSWAALLDFFRALQGNVTNWIRKMERNGMNTLAPHGKDLFGSEGVKASIRAELRLDLKLNKDAWKALSGQEEEDWVSHLVITDSQQRRLSNPRIIAWNAGPHGYRNSREEIWSIFA